MVAVLHQWGHPRTLECVREIPSLHSAGVDPTGRCETMLLPRAGELVDEALRAFDRDEAFAEWVVVQAGLEFLWDERQWWSVGHVQIPVSVWLDPKGRFVLRLHEGWLPESLCLGELYAAAETGEIKRLRGLALAEWKRRALVAAGFARPNKISLAALPPEAPPSARETWAVVTQILADRADGECEIALSAPTVARWWSSSEARIRNGKKWLRQNGYLLKVGERPSGYGKPTDIWRIRMAGEPPLNAQSLGALLAEDGRF